MTNLTLSSNGEIPVMDATLVEEHRFFSTIIETVAALVIVLDNEGRIVRFNKACEKLTGYTFDEVRGQPFWDFLLLPEEIEPVKGVFHSLQAGMFPNHYENCWTTKWQDRRLIAWTNTALLDDLGTVKYIVGTGIDITEKRKAEKEREELLIRERHARYEAQEASRLKDEFLAVMSHELRTPLHAIIGQIGLLLMIGGLDDQVMRRLQRAQANSERLAHLINDILDMTRIEAGHLELTCRLIDPRRVLTRVVTMIQSLGEQKGLDVGLHIAPDVPTTLMLDEDAFTRIATNLLSNAVKFTEKGGIAAHLSVHGDQLLFEVIDTGIGIPEHLHGVIFERFRQVDSSSSRSYGGSGLGLAIVRSLCTAMHGSVRVHSAPDEGSTFTVTLPLKMQ
jgi:PAS domain S-box-containing protein